MSVIKAKINKVREGEVQKEFDSIGRPNEDFKNRSYFQHCGFSSIPRKNAIGIIINDNDNYTMIATSDNQDDRPVLQNDGDCCIYTSKGHYIKLDSDTGEIEAKNDAGKIVIKNNGDIELGEGVNLKNLITEDLIDKLYSLTLPVSGVVAGPYPASSLAGCITTKTKAV